MLCCKINRSEINLLLFDLIFCEVGAPCINTHAVCHGILGRKSFFFGYLRKPKFYEKVNSISRKLHKLSIYLTAWRIEWCVFLYIIIFIVIVCFAIIMAPSEAYNLCIVCGEIHQHSLDSKCASYFWRINQSLSSKPGVHIILTPLHYQNWIAIISRNHENI